ncbi:MAG: fatty acid desaturase [Gammaproteobacteria bacterium]
MEKAPINWTNMLLFSITPAAAITLVPLYGYFYGYDGFEWMVFIVMMAFCGLSITAGYHRMWSHKAYKGHPLLRIVFALGGACALQNDILHWASGHRRHHQFVDNDEHDPYSASRGFWFSHIGWIVREYKSGREDFSNVKDLQQDPVAVWQHRHYLTLVLLTNIGVPALIGYLHGDIIASLLLAGLLRLVLSQHVTYLINSIAHMWGKQTYSDKSSARDNPVLALITYGEGYHNFHHTFQWDYRNGVRWWHFDPTKWLIKSLSWVGLTKDLKKTTPAQIETARLKMQYQSAAAKLQERNIPEQWRQKLEQEYEQFLQLLQQWNEHRAAWLEAREKTIQETLAHWEKLELRDRYRELQYRLKVQKRRWHEMLHSLSDPMLLPS